jgi:lysophospholipase L1-like esterase
MKKNKMRFPLVLIGLFLGLATGATAQEKASFLASMPDFPPPPAAGQNTATYAAPRFDWLYRVKRNIENSSQAASSVQIIFDGDSITDGWQSRGKKIWEQRYAKYGAVNFGIGGDRTENLLWRLSQGQAEGMSPKLIVLLIGINNTGGNSIAKTLPNTHEQIAEGIKAIVAAYQKRCPDAVILLLGIFPTGEKPESGIRAGVKRMNSLISKLADGDRVIFLDFGDQLLQPDGTISRSVMYDFLHPDEKGYQIWADAIQPVIDKYLPDKS